MLQIRQKKRETDNFALVEADTELPGYVSVPETLRGKVKSLFPFFVPSVVDGVLVDVEDNAEARTVAAAVIEEPPEVPDPNAARMDDIEAALIELAGLFAGGDDNG